MAGAAADSEIDAIHRLHDAIVSGKMRLESPDIEQRGLARRLRIEVHHVSRSRHLHDFLYMTFLGSSASRNPSPRKLMASTVRKMAAPANSAQCGAISR